MNTYEGVWANVNVNGQRQSAPGAKFKLAAGRYILAITATTSEPFPVGGDFLRMPEGLTTAEFVDYVATPPDFSDGPPLPQPWYYEAQRSGAPYVTPGQTRYAVVDLTAEPAAVKELDRQLSLNESVVRTKVIRPGVA